MMKGKIIIDFESDESGECSWDITREGPDKLDNDNLKSLLEIILGELMTSEFEYH